MKHYNLIIMSNQQISKQDIFFEVEKVDRLIVRIIKQITCTPLALLSSANFKLIILMNKYID